MARSTAGSPTIFKKLKDRSAATKPTIIPRHNKDPAVITMIPQGELRRRGHADVRRSLPTPCRLPKSALPRPAGIGRAPSVAGEAEQMAAVVHEFMHRHALEDRGRALFGADEI